ncbi:MAG: hypothetical protein ACREQY_13285 [Candidatus Binatia bacterium]
MLLYYVFKSGLWRSLDAEKARFFLGWTERSMLSRQYPLWRSFPWGRAIFSPSGAREIHDWLRYRAELFDGQAG